MKFKHFSFILSLLCVCLTACGESSSDYSSSLFSTLSTDEVSSSNSSVLLSSQESSQSSAVSSDSSSSSARSSSSSGNDSSSVSSSSSSSYIPKDYLVIWLNHDGSLLQSSYEKEGTLPSFKGETPSYNRTDQDGEFYYTFSNWDKEIRVVEEDQTYIATYEKHYLYEMTLSNNRYILKKCVANVDWCTIPREYEGLPVSSIASEAFRWRSTLATVNIPDSIKSIGNRVFTDCPSMKTINVYISDMNNWLNLSGKNYFNYTIHLMNVNGEEIKNIIIPEGVQSIGDYAFRNCSSINNVSLPSSLESIANYAFNNCTNLEEIVFPESLKTIGDYSFEKCKSIKSVLIPNEVTAIGEYAFKDCTRMNNLVFGTSLRTIGKYAFYYCTSLERIDVPINVTHIGTGAFCACRSLKSISIPFVGVSANNFQYLGAIFGAVSFENTPLYDDVAGSVPSSLKIVNVGNACPTIYSWAFRNCINIEKIVFSEGITTIESSVFSNCKKLTSIVIPDSITSFGYQNFSVECPNLVFNEYDNALYLGNENNPYLCLVQAKNKDIESCIINDNCKIIANYAFCDCSKMSTLVMGMNVVIIGDYAFEQCCNLTSITLPASLTRIGNKAFYQCCHLCEIINQSSLNIAKDSSNGYVGYYTEQIISNENESKIVYRSNGFVLFGDYGCFTLIGYQGKDSLVEIPNDVTFIRDFAFYDNEYVESIVVPTSLSKIDDLPIRYCDNFSSLFYKGTKVEWEAITRIDSGYLYIEGTIYYYSETEPTDEDHYWHYVDSIPVPW